MKRLSVSLRHAHKVYGGPRRYFRVVIHDDLADMHAAAERYNGEPLGDDCRACCQPAPTRERLADDGETWEQHEPKHFGGILRFIDGWVTTEIVAHELTHAALVVYRMDINPDVRLGNGCRLREEHLAYITGDLVGAASTVLHDAGVWN
jgi:hypothetical protein